MSMMWCWCSSLCMYICRKAWRSPFNINDVLDSSLTPQWCFGSIFDTSMMFVDLYSISSDGLDLWCQSLTSDVLLVVKNLIGKHCTHLVSGLGSGMPKSVTPVTQVTVNFWAHVTRPHEWRISVDGEENLCEEKNDLRVGVAFMCVDSFRLLTTSVRLCRE